MNKHHKILIADDEPENLFLLREILSESDFEVITAENGAKALEIAESHIPDIILLDVLMPGINGFEVCRKLKSDHKLSHIPVVFLTASNDTESVLEGFKSGGVDYIRKPFEELEIMARLKTHLKINQLSNIIHKKKISVEKLNQKLQTKNKELEHNLRFTENLIESLPIPLFVKDMNGKYTHCNSMFEKYIKTDKAEIIGRTVHDLLEKKDADYMIKKDHEIESWEEVQRFEKNIKVAEGKDRIILLNKSRFRDQNNQAAGIIGTFIDITEQKKNEQKILESEERYRTFINSLDDFVTIKNCDYKHIVVNKAFLKFVGLSEQAVIGKTDFEIMPEELAAQCRLSDKQMQAERKQIVTEESMNGRFFHTKKFPVKLTNGAKGIGAVIKDITQNKIQNN